MIPNEENQPKEDISDEEVQIDFKRITSLFRSNKLIIPFILILIAIFSSVYFRVYPAHLPIADDWAKSSIHNLYMSQIRAQVDEQYPNLPESDRAAIAENEFESYLKENKAQISEQIKSASRQFKSEFRFTAENGKDYMYLSDIDTYLWYGEAKNYLRYAHLGTDIVNGKEINYLRNGRQGIEGIGSRLHIYFGVYLYKLSRIFINLPLMAVFFFISPVIIGASIIPAFFIGRRLGGNIGGFFAAMIVAVNSALMSRTMASVADTDPWNAFFPLMILWLFLEAFESDKFAKQITCAVLSGFFTGLYSYAWMGWWFVFDFIIVMSIIYFVYLLILRFRYSELSLNQFKYTLIIGGLYIITSAIFVTIFGGFQSFLSSFILNPFHIITMKDVGVTTIWPNVLTTVAEFNTVPLSQITAQMGENLLFWISLMGLVILLVNRKKINLTNLIYIILSGIYYYTILSLENQLNEPATFMFLIGIPVIVGLIKIVYLKEYKEIDIKVVLLITIWFFGTAYGFTKGIRFGILMVPAFASAFGASIGFAYRILYKLLIKRFRFSRVIAKLSALLLLGCLLLSPIKTAHAFAKKDIIIMNDGWYDSLIGIKNNSKDAIITSWWDYGHWFVAIAERRVTFDGADQGERIHWVGKSLLTPDEDAAIGILRMLNCGQERTPHLLEKYLNGDTVEAIDLVNRIIVQDKRQAELTLKEKGISDMAIEEILNTTHCDELIEQYYITSEDMVGKSGVWAHFGIWGFKRAKIYNNVNGKGYYEGIKILKEQFNVSDEQAPALYDEIQKNSGDGWISPWPRYAGISNCNKNEDILICENNIEINLTEMNAYSVTTQGKAPLKSLSFINKNNEFEVKEYQGNTAPYSVALTPSYDKAIMMSPELAGSMFTRLFFFRGYGLKHFKLFSERRGIVEGIIQVWKVELKE